MKWGFPVAEMEFMLEMYVLKDALVESLNWGITEARVVTLSCVCFVDPR